MTDFDARIESLEADLKANLVKAMDAMNAEPNTSTIRAYTAAKKALDSFLAEQNQVDAGERFRNIEQAAAWIAGAGYLVSARTVRNHADRAAGFPRKQKDGSFLKSEIEAYAAQAWENPSRPSAPADDEDSDHKKRYLKEQADKLAFTRTDADITRLHKWLCENSRIYINPINHFFKFICHYKNLSTSEYLSIPKILTLVLILLTSPCKTLPGPIS
mgnify:CR=1 FL=1